MANVLTSNVSTRIAAGSQTIGRILGGALGGVVGIVGGAAAAPCMAVNLLGADARGSSRGYAR